MALYRATNLLVNRILTGRIPCKAFVAAVKSDIADPSGGADVSGVIGGLAFRDLIDLANRTFNLPATLRPPAEAYAADAAGVTQPVVRAAINLDAVSLVFGVGLRGGPLYFNRYFECDLANGNNYAARVAAVLVALGLLATAGSLTDAAVPAALNTNFANLPPSGEYLPPSPLFHLDPGSPGSEVPYRRAVIKIARFTPAGPITGTLEGARQGDQILVETDTGSTTVSVAPASGAWSAALTANAYARATLVGGAIGADRRPIGSIGYPYV